MTHTVRLVALILALPGCADARSGRLAEVPTGMKALQRVPPTGPPEVFGPVQIVTFGDFNIDVGFADLWSIPDAHG